MNTKTIPARWLGETGRRLDPGPYLSGAVEAKENLRLLKVKKNLLSSLTSGYGGGIYNGPQFSRNYVESAEHGVPFLGSSSMLQADLSDVSLLRRRDAISPKLRHLRLEEGMTLISCSGTIGRMVYTRPDMSGMWSSQDIMKVVPDSEKIPAGYLYGFLASRFGVPMVTSGTYGAIIQHIEPEHLWELPIPRLGEAIEVAVDALVREAARRRANAARTKTSLLLDLHNWFGWTESQDDEPVNVVGSNKLQRRLDAFHHSHRIQNAHRAFAARSGGRVVGDVGPVVESGRFKRVRVHSKEHGYPFYSSSDVFLANLEPTDFLARRSNGVVSLLTGNYDVLVPRSGQIGGLIGRAVTPVNELVGVAVSEHLIRIQTQSRATSIVLWALLATQPGYFCLVGTAFGSSIPSLDRRLVQNIPLPEMPVELEAQVIQQGQSIIDCLSKAMQFERQAIQIVEDFISAR